MQAISRVREVVRSSGEGQAQVRLAISFRFAVSELTGGTCDHHGYRMALPKGLPSSGMMEISALIMPGNVLTPYMSETLLHADGGRVGLRRGGVFDRQCPALSSTLFPLLDFSGTGQRRNELQWQMQLKTWLCLLEAP